MDFRYIAIEGPIGVGKSTLAERVAARLEATSVLEESDNPFLDDFYAGRAGAAGCDGGNRPSAAFCRLVSTLRSSLARFSV